MAFVVDVADSIFRELSDDSGVSIASISYWLRANVGRLNTLLNKNYSSQNNSTLELINADDGMIIGDWEATILTRIFLIDYYSRLVRKFSGVGGIDIVNSVSSDGGVVKFLDRNRIAQNYIQMRKEVVTELKTLVNYYKIGHLRASQVAGDDVFASVIPLPRVGFPYVRSFPQIPTNVEGG